MEKFYDLGPGFSHDIDMYEELKFWYLNFSVPMHSEFLPREATDKEFPG